MEVIDRVISMLRERLTEIDAERGEITEALSKLDPEFKDELKPKSTTTKVKDKAADYKDRAKKAVSSKKSKETKFKTLTVKDSKGNLTKMGKVLEKMQEDPTKRWTPSELAEACNVSSTNLKGYLEEHDTVFTLIGKRERTGRPSPLFLLYEQAKEEGFLDEVSKSEPYKVPPVKMQTMGLRREQEDKLVYETSQGQQGGKERISEEEEAHERTAREMESNRSRYVTR